MTLLYDLLSSLSILLCCIGLHDSPIRDRTASGLRLWRCPRCLKVRPRDASMFDPVENTPPRRRRPDVRS